MPKRKKPPIIPAKTLSLVVGCEGQQDKVFLEYLWDNFKREGREKPNFIGCGGGGDLKKMKEKFLKKMKKYTKNKKTNATLARASIYLFLDEDKEEPLGKTSQLKIGNYGYEIIFIKPKCLEGFIFEKILNKKLKNKLSDKNSQYYKKEAKTYIKEKIGKKDSPDYRKTFLQIVGNAFRCWMK